MLNQIEYCERRFFLMHVLGEMEINAPVLDGTLRHEQAHDAGAERQEGKMVHRRVYVWSDELRLAGFADIVEEIDPEPASENQGGRPLIVPVEYKRGRMGRWLNDHVQLCAQALCLEERLGSAVEKGFIFYFGSRRREEVNLTFELRERTRQAIRRAGEIVQAGVLPPPLANQAKCRDCSLEPVCLPKEMMILKAITKLPDGQMPE